MRRIPATMATQHPDNAFSPFWETDGDGFVSVREEPEECLMCLRDLDTGEYMWDWEGKYADEAVIDKLFSTHYDYFKKHLLGRDKFLTFRLPNVWKERGYSLIRALMVILTSEDFALDLKFKARPLFEVILPMTETAEQLMYIQESFQKLARFKSEAFSHRTARNTDYVELIPLVEGVEHQLGIKDLLEKYVRMHEAAFGRKPRYIRPFLARSDPALVSGIVPSMLANKIALSDLRDFSKKYGIPTYPILGAGSLVFRGGLNPLRIRSFVDQYAGVRTATIQSAFRYDYPRASVEKALAYLEKQLPKRTALHIAEADRKALVSMIKKFSHLYVETTTRLVPDLDPVFAAVPRRRERRQHIGFLAYQRSLGKRSLPRAINFAAAFYSIGVPPEFIGLGRALASLSEKEMQLLDTYYANLKDDVLEAGKYLNRENLSRLAAKNIAWRKIIEDVELTERILGMHFMPKGKRELLHENLSSQLLLLRGDQKEMSRLIAETGKLRRSLG